MDALTTHNKRQRQSDDLLQPAPADMGALPLLPASLPLVLSCALRRGASLVQLEDGMRWADGPPANMASGCAGVDQRAHAARPGLGCREPGQRLGR